METELKEQIQQIERLVARIRGATDPVMRDAALELVQTLMTFHAAGIDRMMEVTAEAGDAGWRIIDEFARDELVTHLLLLHGMHPLDLETRVRDALARVRPYLQSHGGNVELLEIAGSAVRLRLIGSCNGCPSSSITLRTAIEKAIYESAPDVTSVQCDAEPQLTVIHNAA
jgi:Fe-S cluster biogenesis protein NfuA